MESGTHESLLKIENGIYANLCNMQTFEKDDSNKITEKKEKQVIQKQKSVIQDKDDEELDEGIAFTNFELKLGRFYLIDVQKMFSEISSCGENLN
jgi:hypothetical protein